MSALTQEQRRDAQRGLARRAILDASEALLLEDGYEAFSIRRLVERCGYTAPTLYAHFGDKDGLLDALVENRFAALTRQLQRVPRGPDPVTYLRAMALAFVRFGLRNPTHYRLLFVPRAGRPTPPSADEARELMGRAWVELSEAGRLRAGEWRSAGQALWALGHGIVMGRIALPDTEWSKTLVEDSIDALLHGLVIDAEALAPVRRLRKEAK